MGGRSNIGVSHCFLEKVVVGRGVIIIEDEIDGGRGMGIVDKLERNILKLVETFYDVVECFFLLKIGVAG